MQQFIDIIQRVYVTDKPEKSDLVTILKTTDQDKLDELYSFADRVRKEHCGDGVLLRGIVEISNECDNTCLYCGLNKYNKKLVRYRMDIDEVMSSVDMIVSAGMKTVVIQSGEAESFSVNEIESLIKKIKERYHDIAITLSLGEYSAEVYEKWRKAGADRYLLKQETIDKLLYAKLHPDMSQENRIKCLESLRELNYQVGSGILIGLPNQTEEILADDILMFKEFDFDMIGIGPLIPHGQTELSSCDQGDVVMTLKCLALTRIVTKNAHLPATTALGSVNEGDLRLDALKAGANVLMPNFTPAKYKAIYEIYPNKRCIDEPTGACALCMAGLVKSIGRYVDFARGDSLK